jgi:hypothetical protein
MLWNGREARSVTAVRPVLVGYQVVRVSSSVDELTRGRRLLAEYAAKEGFSLGDVLVERDVNRPCSALVALIGLVRGSDIGVAVPTPLDLGRLPRVQRLMRERLEREAGVRVVVVEPWGATGSW